MLCAKGNGNMTQEDSGSSRIEVTVAHDPLAFMYDKCTPTITIKGERIHSR